MRKLIFCGAVCLASVVFADRTVNHTTLTNSFNERGLISPDYPAKVPELPWMEEQGLTFYNSDGIYENHAIQIGEHAHAAVRVEDLQNKSNQVIRSTSIAIGGNADATDHSNPTKSQSIAIGWYAQATANNAIAIGNGAQHASETPLTGHGTVANASCAIAVGYDAKATGSTSVSIGRSAKATGDNSAQLGTGTNPNKGTLQFRDWTVVDNSGQIPPERLVSASSMVITQGMAQVARLSSPGNMTVDCVGGDEQTIEPMLKGSSELSYKLDYGEWVFTSLDGFNTAITNRGPRNAVTLTFQAVDNDGDERTVVATRTSPTATEWSYDWIGASGSDSYDFTAFYQESTNGIWRAGSEVGVIPPLDSRNYDIIVSEILQAYGTTNGVSYPMPPEDNMIITFDEIPDPIQVILKVAEGCGIWVPGSKSVALTNAPLLIKVRQPATNKVYAVIKQFSIEEML